ncbi:hypothetical protein [Reyranella sp.]|uniref:hypothetical protein n=1 Tax=Reyranella sp. TaxID=1929291 RepID=UPI003D0A7A26
MEMPKEMPVEMRVIRKAVLAAALLAAGCAQVPMADPQADQIGRSFPPPEPGKGALYVYRSGIMGVAKPIDVAILGGASAQLATNTYLRLEGPPGPVEVDCKVGDKTGGGQVQIGEGSTRYVEVSMKIGLMLPGCEVAEVPAEQGQAAVRGSRRVAPQ